MWNLKDGNKIIGIQNKVIYDIMNINIQVTLYKNHLHAMSTIKPKIQI